MLSTSKGVLGALAMIGIGLIALIGFCWLIFYLWDIVSSAISEITNFVNPNLP